MRGHPKEAEKPDERPDNEELDNWPIIGAAVPERMIGMIGLVDRWRLEIAVDEGVAHIRSAIERLGITDPLYLDAENGVQFKFLLDTMLRYSRTPEQVCNMVNGYLAFCVRECGQREFRRNPLSDMARDHMISVIDMSFLVLPKWLL